MSDTIAVGYLQMFVVFLVFGLGVPAFAFQVLIPEEVKRVIRKNRIVASWDILFMAALYLLAVVLFSAIVAASDAENATVSRRWLPNAMVSIVSGLTVFLWWYQTRKPMLNTIVERLVRKIQNQIDWYGTLNDSLLEDVVSIGKSLREGSDRIRILRAIDTIANVCQERHGYRGDRLEKLIAGVEGIVLEGSDVDDESLRLASEILERIVDRAERRQMLPFADAHQALRSLRRIAVMTLVTRSETVGYLLTMAMARTDLHENLFGLFEAGRLAIASRRYLIAVEALSILESECERRNLQNRQMVAGFLGLAAHFYSRDGECRRSAMASLMRIRSSRSVEVGDLISGAIEIFGDRLDFETIDLLEDLKQKLPQKP